MARLSRQKLESLKDSIMLQNQTCLDYTNELWDIYYPAGKRVNRTSVNDFKEELYQECLNGTLVVNVEDNTKVKSKEQSKEKGS